MLLMLLVDLEDSLDDPMSPMKLFDWGCLEGLPSHGFKMFKFSLGMSIAPLLVFTVLKLTSLLEELFFNFFSSYLLISSRSLLEFLFLTLSFELSLLKFNSLNSFYSFSLVSLSNLSKLLSFFSDSFMQFLRGWCEMT